MKHLKWLLSLLCASLIIACTTGSEESSNEGNDDTKPETPVKVDELPDGIEIGDKTVQLNNIQLENLIEVDEENSTLTFSATLDEKHTPSKDQILLQYFPTEKLPYGFLGQVTKVTNNGNTIIVETESPMLDEAFEKLCYNYEFDILPESSRALVETDEDGYTYINPEGTLEFPYGSVHANIGVGGKISMLRDMDVNENKNDTKHRLDIKFKANLDANIKASGDGPKKYIPLIKNGINLRVAANAIGIKVVMIPCGVMKASGEAGFKFNGSYEANRSFIISSDADTKQNGTFEDINNNNDASGSSSIGDINAGFYLDGTIFTGAAAKFQLSLFGREDLMMEITPELGTNWTATLPADFTKLGYTSFKDNQITTSIGFGVEASAKVKIAKWEPKWTIPLVSLSFGKQTNYLFPDFKDGTYNINESQTANGSITVERDLFWKNDIAIGQYDANGNIVEVKGSLPYKYQSGFSNPLTASFIHKDEHSYWSVIKWGSDYLKCVELEQLDSYILSKMTITTDAGNPYTYLFEYDDIGRIQKVICVSNEEDNISFTYSKDKIITNEENYPIYYSLNEKGLIKSIIDKYEYTSPDGFVLKYLTQGDYTYSTNNRLASGKHICDTETTICIHQWTNDNLIEATYDDGDKQTYKYNSILNDKTNIDLNHIVIGQFDESGFPIHLEVANWATYYLTAQGYTGPRSKNFVVKDSYEDDETYIFDWVYDSSNVPISCTASGDGEYMKFSFEYK